MEQPISTEQKPGKRGPLGGIVTAVVAVAVIAGAGFGGWRYVAGQQAAATATAQFTHDFGRCGVVLVDDAVKAMGDIVAEFADLNDVAAATARIALSPHVVSMQSLRGKVHELEVPQCLASARLYLELGIDDAIRGYLAFMSQEPDRIVSGHFESAGENLASYRSAVARVQGCAPDCAGVIEPE